MTLQEQQHEGLAAQFEFHGRQFVVLAQNESKLREIVLETWGIELDSSKAKAAKLIELKAWRSLMKRKRKRSKT